MVARRSKVYHYLIGSTSHSCDGLQCEKAPLTQSGVNWRVVEEGITEDTALF